VTTPPRGHPLHVDRLFRWRGQDVSRLESFSDAAFAFALTYLALTSIAPRNFGELGEVLSGFVPFAVTFALLIMVWIDHYLFFRRYDLRDGVTMLLNSVLLFLVLFYVYPLKFVFTYLAARWFGAVGGVSWQEMHAGGETLPFNLMVFYSAGFGAIYIVFALLYGNAWRHRDRLGLDVVERRITRNALESCAVLVAFALASIAVVASGLNAHARGLEGWIYFGIGPALGVHGFLRGAEVARLARAG
jgi:hypothetical protein